MFLSSSFTSSESFRSLHSPFFSTSSPDTSEVLLEVLFFLSFVWPPFLDVFAGVWSVNQSEEVYINMHVVIMAKAPIKKPSKGWMKLTS